MILLTVAMLKPDKSGFENTVDSYQLASSKPADMDLHCFPLTC